MDDQQQRFQRHFSIECDQCSGVICGIRYKCMECEDYDLCSDCERLKLHPEHLMLRLSHLCIEGLPKKTTFDICLEGESAMGKFNDDLHYLPNTYYDHTNPSITNSPY
jgi:Zinc finger, ZZ type